MNPDLEHIYRRLCHRWTSLPDQPGLGEDWDDIERRMDAVVHLANWIRKNPEASITEYRAEVQRWQTRGSALRRP